MRTCGWFTAFVGAQKSDIEIETREIEIVRIAAELCNCKLRRKHQAHIGVALVTIQIVNAAVVERNEVAADAGFGSAAMLQFGGFGV